MSKSDRSSRKIEHLQAFLALPPGGRDYFTDIHLVGKALPEIDLSAVDLQTTVFKKSWSAPIYINAITGGSEDSQRINRALARAAREFRIPMAVGSQMAALEDARLIPTYTVVRDEYPEGFLFANIGAYATPDQAEQAVEMIAADALQIHLNVAQELVMHGGDRTFKGAAERIHAICQRVSVPVVIKEVGFGISKEDAILLMKTGAAALDVGGRGGTNFVRIEEKRRGNRETPFHDWGLPTPVSLAECLTTLQKRIPVFASGGVDNGVKAVKCLALGATAVGVAGAFLAPLLKGGEDSLRQAIAEYLYDVKITLLLIGVTRPADAIKVPVVMTGFTAEWLSRRGIPVNAWAQRPDFSPGCSGNW